VKKWLSAQSSFVHAVVLASLVGWFIYTISGVGHGAQLLVSGFILAAVDGAVFVAAWLLLRAVRGRW